MRRFRLGGVVSARKLMARILIVEDEALVALELRFVLEDLGHDVAGVAAESRPALEIAQALPIDLALVDIHLSDGPTGVELGRALAQQEGVSVLFMTANPGMLNDGVAGAVGVLSKPMDEAAVGGAIDYALCRSDPARALPAPPGLQLFG